MPYRHKRPAPIGQRYGRLVVTGEVYAPPKGKSAGRWDWICKCDCGTEFQVRKGAVKSGHTSSCGCYHSDRIAEKNHRHGQARTYLYWAWQGMFQRCYNPKATWYPDYGGRGITVCDEWRDFERFAADMGERPTPMHSLDRRDNDAGYSPGNCRWATRRQQMNNTGRVIAARNRKLNRIIGGTMSENANTQDRAYAIDCHLRREKDPTKRQQLMLLLAMVKNDDLPRQYLSRQMAIMTAAKPRVRVQAPTLQ